jgi:hypothetical protein
MVGQSLFMDGIEDQGKVTVHWKVLLIKGWERV